MTYSKALQTVGKDTTPLRGSGIKSPTTAVDEYFKKDVKSMDNLDSFKKDSDIKFTSHMTEGIDRRKLAGPYANLPTVPSKTFTGAIKSVTGFCKGICPDLQTMVDMSIQNEEKIARANARGAEIERSLRDLSSSNSYGFSI